MNVWLWLARSSVIVLLLSAWSGDAAFAAWNPNWHAWQLIEVPAEFALALLIWAQLT